MNQYIQLLASALSIWEHKLANKYRDKFIAIKKELYVEENKDKDHRDDARIDNLHFELYLLGEGYSSEARKTNVANSGGPSGSGVSVLQV